MNKRAEQDPAGIGIPERDTVKKAFDDFASSTSLHGYQYIASSGYVVIKLCWLTISITFFVLFVLQAQMIIKDFRKYPYATKIELISRPSLTFPAVTVCNSNRMRRSQLLDTRFEGLVDVDGGTSDPDDDYSWWFSSWYYQWYSSWYSSLPAGFSSDTFDTSSLDSESSSSSASNWTSSSPITGSLSQSSAAPSQTSDSTSSAGFGKRKKRSLKISLKELKDMLANQGKDPMGPKARPSPDRHPQPQRSRHKRHTGRGQPATLSRRARSVPSSLSSFSSLSSSWSSWWAFLDDFSWWDQYQDSDFYYYDDGWDTVDGEDDWEGFYENSKADDYSDLIDVVNPTMEELAEFGHQLDDFVLQCTFDRRQCNKRYNSLLLMKFLEINLPSYSMQSHVSIL